MRAMQEARRECSADNSNGLRMQRPCGTAFSHVLTSAWLVVRLEPLLSHLQNWSAPPPVTAGAKQEQSSSM